MTLPRILYFLVGVGAGNTTRTLAILSEVKRQSPEIEIHLAAQGKSLELLRERFTVHPMRTVNYGTGSGGMNPLGIIFRNLSFPIRFLQNRRLARDLIREIRPALVVADSDYNCLGPARSLGVPLASVNSSPATMALIRHYGVPSNCWPSANLIEKTDAFLQRRYPNRVVAPVIRPMKGLEAKVRQVPLIVRPEVLQQPGESIGPGERRNVVVVTGGSGIGTADIDLSRVDAPMIVYGTRLEKVPRHAEQRHFDLRAFEEMKRARVLVVQGGFSSVSEALALRIPTVVLPIAGHAEQHVNALEVEALGMGLSSPGPRADDAVERVLANYDTFWSRCQDTRVRHDGAPRAARLLLEMIR